MKEFLKNYGVEIGLITALITVMVVTFSFDKPPDREPAEQVAR